MGDVEDLPDDVILDRYLSDDKIRFFQSYTNTRDEELRDLARHILNEWRSAIAKTHGYRCIREFAFLIPGVPYQFFYSTIKSINDRSVAEGEGGVKLCEIGSCFGTDVRQLIVDGFKAEKVSAIDVNDAYWQIGLRLFQDNKNPSSAIHSVRTYFGSLIDPNFFHTHQSVVQTNDIALAALVLHVFDEEGVSLFVRAVKNLLRNDGIFVGWNVGVKGGLEGEWSQLVVPGTSKKRYLHSRDSLEKVFCDEGYTDVDVREVSWPSYITVDSSRFLPDKEAICLVFSCRKST